MKRTLLLLTALVGLLPAVPSANGQFDFGKAKKIFDQVQRGQRSSGGSSQPPEYRQHSNPSIPSEKSDRNVSDQRFKRGDDLRIGGPISGGGQPVQPGQPVNGQPIIIDSRPRDQYGRLIPQPSGQQPVRVGESYYIDEFGRRIVIPSQGQTSLPTHQNRSGAISQAGSDIPSAPVEMATNPYIIIRCPGSTVGSLPYKLESSKGSYQFQISAGQEQRFRQSTAWTISFFNGLSTLKYRLVAGKTYVITKGDDNRWQVTGTPHYGS